MIPRRILVFVILVSLCILSCRAAAEIVTPEAPPTEEPTQIPEDTPAPTEVPPTQAPALLEPTATSEEHVPVITSVELRPETTDSQTTIYQDIHFQDSKGDVYFVNYEILSSTTEDVSVEGGKVNIPAEEQKAGATITGTWDCGDGNYEVTLAVQLTDTGSVNSEPYEYTIVCGQGELAQGFPDPFDDNRNGWPIGEYGMIEGGVLKFSDLPSGSTGSMWCAACIVTPKQNTASVEVTWANTPNESAGLLVDNAACKPDRLVFIITPSGYYSILQSVRDEEGNWKHWTPYKDWTRSDKIRKARNTPNLISATYEFGDDLHVIFYINDTQVIRMEIPGYNGSGECQSGVFVSSDEFEASFDNFSISPASP